MLDKKLVRQVMSELGRKGGKIGGKAAAESMTAEQRSARAKKASTAAAKKRTAERLAREAKTRPAQNAKKRK